MNSSIPELAFLAEANKSGKQGITSKSIKNLSIKDCHPNTMSEMVKGTWGGCFSTSDCSVSSSLEGFEATAVTSGTNVIINPE